jgi:hypothetical protein
MNAAPAPDPKPDFRTIPHSGGTVTIDVSCDEKTGGKCYRLTWNHCRASAAALFAVWALPPGIIISQMNLGGYGSPIEAPPVPGCYQVFIGSDAEGKFGRQCIACRGYWRSELGQFCPYCGFCGTTIEFMTDGQRAYVEEWCATMYKALKTDVGGQYVIDLDAVADAADAALPEKPAFFYSETGQQSTYNCDLCNAFNDILGNYGYCTRCGTRNDLHIFGKKTIPQIRSRINSGGPYEACAKEAVAAFDSFIGQYADQLVRRVPMTSGRRARLGKVRFHDLEMVEHDMREMFDIDITNDLTDDDKAFAKRMFHRRHIYEHRGGEADQKYINDSGETNVLVGQALRETVDSAHRIVNVVLKLARNVHDGFHEIFLVDKRPIERYAAWRPKPRPTIGPKQEALDA